MMDGLRIVSTKTAGLRPLGASGQRSHALLVDTLRRDLSQAHADLFAEPVPTPDGAQIDWYAAVDGEATPFEQADPATREAAQTDLGRLVIDIEQLADRLEHSGAAEDQQRAAALRHALSYPDDSYLWIVDGRPVVTAWAHLHQDVGRPGATLTAWVKSAPKPIPPAPSPVATPTPAPAAATVMSAPAAPVEESRSPWLTLLLWLILLLLLLAITLKLLPACGIGFPGRAALEEAGILDRCPDVLAATDRSELEREALRQDVLESEIDRLRRDLALQGNECRAQAAREAERQRERDVATDQGDEGETELPGPSFDERVEREGGETGAMNISLAWQGQSDLDLVVRCPSGEIIDYQNANACGGRLQIDMNSRPNSMSDSPVEDVVWPEGNAQPGSYEVGVKLYEPRQPTPIPFVVRVNIGDEQQTYPGTVVNKGDVVRVTTVEIP